MHPTDAPASDWWDRPRPGRLQRWLSRLSETRPKVRHLDEDDVVEAYRLQELSLAYQPVVGNSGEIAGAKALLRWCRPGQAPVEAAQFVPAIADPDVVRHVGDLVVHQVVAALPAIRACVQVARPYVSMTAWAEQLEDRMFAARLAAQLHANGIEPDGLAVELGDPAGVRDWDAVTDTSDELALLGVAFVVEDAGVEPGDLLHHDRCHASMVRIDAATVARSRQWHHERDVVEQTLRLCRATGIPTVVQGVEDRESFDWLRRCGADYLSGFGIGRPEGLEELLERLDPDGSPARGLRRWGGGHAGDRG